jgi:(R,R)-butanediol dehydrogenase / meso-butanediol dehydrogenase / diacetyl reductase
MCCKLHLVRAVVVEDVEQLTVATRPEPDPAGRALVAVERAGLCGTDLKILSGAIPVSHPLVLGHEVVGRVVAAGARGLVPDGTRVLINPVISDGSCALCRRDRANLCPNGALLGRDRDGLFAELVAVDELQLHPVPDHIPADEAVLLQVLGTCVHAQSLVEAQPDATAVVIGLGTTGLLHVQLLRARGVGSAIGVTRSAAKRELATALGATAVAPPDQAAAVVAEATGGRGADLVVESVGTVATLAQSIDLAGPGATVLVYGIVTGEGQLPYPDLYYKELDVVSARAALPRDYDRAVALVAADRLRLGPLLSATFPLDQAPKAVEAIRTDPALLKVSLAV